MRLVLVQSGYIRFDSSECCSRIKDKVTDLDIWIALALKFFLSVLLMFSVYLTRIF